jgi:hypothetical protein
MRNKKWTAAALASCLTVVFAASVSVALNYGGYASATMYPGGTGTGTTGPVEPWSPPTNCSAWVRRYSNLPDPSTGYPYIIDWRMVQGNSLAACTAQVNSYLNMTNQHWELSPGTPWGCTCAEPGLGLLIDHGGYDVVQWNSARDAALNVKLKALRQEFRVDEYFKRVNEVVNQELDSATKR